MTQVWLKRLIEGRRKYKQFMQVRYARFDFLNRTLLILALFISLFRFWLPFSLGDILTIFLIGIITYRYFSKKIYPRLNENQAFLQKTDCWKNVLFRLTNKERVNQKVIRYTFFSCPTCHQNQRAPQGKGRIRVTCKKCGTQFETKV